MACVSRRGMAVARSGLPGMRTCLLHVLLIASPALCLVTNAPSPGESEVAAMPAAITATVQAEAAVPLDASALGAIDGDTLSSEMDVQKLLQFMSQEVTPSLARGQSAARRAARRPSSRTRHGPAP